MKNKKLLLLLTLPLLVACGNKGGNQPSSSNGGSTSGDTSVTSTTTTPTDPGTSTTEDNPPVEPEEFVSVEEQFNIPDIAGIDSVRTSFLPYEVLAVAANNIKNSNSYRIMTYEWYLDSSTSILVPYSSKKEVVNYDEYTYKFFDVGNSYEETYYEKYIVDGNLEYFYGYDDISYDWYEFPTSGTNMYKCYQESNPRGGSTSYYVDYYENTSSKTKDDVINDNAISMFNAFYYQGIPGSVIDESDSSYVAGFVGDEFVFAYSYVTSNYCVYKDVMMPEYQRNIELYFAKEIGDQGYCFTRSVCLQYCYFLENILGEKFANPKYSYINMREASYYYDDLGDFAEPVMKESTSSTVSVNPSYVPRLNPYDVESDTYVASSFYINFSRMNDVVVDEKTYATYALRFVDLSSYYYYTIASLSVTYDIYADFDKFISCPNVLRELTPEEEAYSNKPACLFVTDSDEHYDYTLNIYVMVDVTNGDISLIEGILL